MALNPLIIDEFERVEIVEDEFEPSRTYEFDFDRGEFTGRIIDNERAVKQFIAKALGTPRFRHLIYNDDYGCELEEQMIGKDLPFEFLESEVPRIITEAIIYDERVVNVHSFEIGREDDKLLIVFKVDTVFGITLQEEVVI